MKTFAGCNGGESDHERQVSGKTKTDSIKDNARHPR